MRKLIAADLLRLLELLGEMVPPLAAPVPNIHFVRVGEGNSLEVARLTDDVGTDNLWDFLRGIQEVEIPPVIKLPNGDRMLWTATCFQIKESLVGHTSNSALAA